VGKKCHACGKEVTEAHTGKCPHCGKEEGYAITRVINETITINDFITTEKNSMKNALNDAYLRFDNLQKKYPDNQKMLENIKIKRKLLEDQEKALMKAVEDSAKFDFESAKKSIGIKSFTVDTILVTEDQKKILELENKVIAKEITIQHRTTVQLRNQMVQEYNHNNYPKYISLVSRLKKAEGHELKLEKDWWIIQGKIRKARKDN